MKTTNRILLAAAMAAGLTLAAPAKAQNSTAGDGLTASPKARQMLNERQARVNVASSPATTASAKACCARDDLAASPKARQMLGEQQKCCVAPTTGTVASANDGITASPKLREQLNERSLKFQIAPLK